MVTINDIANRVGVSNQVVSKVLHGGRSTIRTSEKTRKRVMQVAAEMGYRPNSSAQSMRNRRFGSVCLLQSSRPSVSLLPVFLLDGIHDALLERDLHLTVAKLPDEQLVNTGYVPRILREWGCDGLIINYNHSIPSAMIKLIVDNRVPAVWVNSKQEHDCVFPEDVAAGAMATKALVSAGHRRIGFVDYSHGLEPIGGHHSTVDRFEGYAKILQQSGGKPFRVAGRTEVVGADRAAFSRQWLSHKDRPTAIVTYTASEARAAIVAAMSLGLRVPQDLSVVAIHAAGQLMDIGLSVDTVVLPEYRIGQEAVRLVVELIKEPEAAHAPLAVPPSFVAGCTIAPPGETKA